MRDWAGAPLPESLQQRLARADARLQLVAEQIAALETRAAARGADRAGGERGAALSAAERGGDDQRDGADRRRLGLAGVYRIAANSAACWALRRLKSESGETSRDQGVSRAGNDRLQATMVQLAWGWVHWQPQSALTRWYLARFGTGKRVRKVGIVALAQVVNVKPNGALILLGPTPSGGARQCSYGQPRSSLILLRSTPLAPLLRF